MNESVPVITLERIQRAIYLIRGEKVMLYRDLAALYAVTTAGISSSARHA